MCKFCDRTDLDQSEFTDDKLVLPNIVPHAYQNRSDSIELNLVCLEVILRLIGSVIVGGIKLSRGYFL